MSQHAESVLTVLVMVAIVFETTYVVASVSEDPSSLACGFVLDIVCLGDGAFSGDRNAKTVAHLCGGLDLAIV